MNKLNHVISSLIVAAASVTVAVGAQAQTRTSTQTSSAFAPAGGYVGISVGQSDFSLGNGIGVFGSDQGDTSYSIHGGAYFSNNFGVELGYTDFGSVNRAGGKTKADGINLSLIGKMPINPSLNLLGKIGTTYSRTEVSSNPASGVVAGTANGYGLSYGVGVEYAFNPRWSGVLQYESQDVKFAGDRSDRVGNTSLGVRYQY